MKANASGSASTSGILSDTLVDRSPQKILRSSLFDLHPPAPTTPRSDKTSPMCHSLHAMLWIPVYDVCSISSSLVQDQMP